MKRILFLSLLLCFFACSKEDKQNNGTEVVFQPTPTNPKEDCEKQKLYRYVDNTCKSFYELELPETDIQDVSFKHVFLNKYLDAVFQLQEDGFSKPFIKKIILVDDNSVEYIKDKILYLHKTFETGNLITLFAHNGLYDYNTTVEYSILYNSSYSQILLLREKIKNTLEKVNLKNKLVFRLSQELPGLRVISGRYKFIFDVDISHTKEEIEAKINEIL